MLLKQRQDSGFSQRQLAAKVGCSQPYLAQVETGVRPISKRIAAKLEVVFEVPPMPRGLKNSFKWGWHFRERS